MMRTGRVARLSVVVPCVLAAGYVVLLIARFPRLIRWENGDSDIASAYVLADWVTHGHTGHVVMSTQGSWASLWYGLLTHGLTFHRVLWEISPALLLLGAALLIGWSVARVGDSLSAGALAVALIVAASPTALFAFTGAFFHNTTLPGVAILGAYLVWLTDRRRRRRAVVASTLLVSVTVGIFLASDELLAVVGIVPFLGVVLLRSARTRDKADLAPVISVTAGAVVVAVITSAIMRGLDFSTTAPALRFTSTLVPDHLRWLGQGLLRMGNGLSVAPHSGARTPLVVAAAVVTICALATMLWLAGRSALRPVGRGRDLHLMFWAGSLLCAAAAYVVTTVAGTPTDRYFIVAVPAVAATVPLLMSTTRSTVIVSAGATIFIAASVTALASNDERRLIYVGSAVPQASQIEAFVKSQHLSVGYAGYWDAANLDWVTHERLHVYPITDRFGPTESMYLARVAAWYRPRPNTPSYLLLTPQDADLADRVPRDLPSPQHEYRVGTVTLAVYPYDIAALLHPPSRAPGT